MKNIHFVKCINYNNMSAQHNTSGCAQIIFPVHGVINMELHSVWPSGSLTYTMVMFPGNCGYCKSVCCNMSNGIGLRKFSWLFTELEKISWYWFPYQFQSWTKRAFILAKWLMGMPVLWLIRREFDVANYISHWLMWPESIGYRPTWNCLNIVELRRRSKKMMKKKKHIYYA